MNRISHFILLFAFAAVVPSIASDEPWSFRAGRGITLNEAAKVAVGLEVETVETSGNESALFIAESALVETVRGDFVYTLNGAAYLRVAVKTGTRADGRVEIIDGLLEGDEVVVGGAYDLWMIELQAVNGGRGCADGH